jgi:hypothetical protein
MRTRSYYHNDTDHDNNNNMNYIYMYAMTLYNLSEKNKLIFNTLFLYASWIVIHYISSHTYSTYCTNYSLWGFIISPIMSSTPACRGLSWIIYNGSDKIFNMWNLIGALFLNQLTKTDNIK